MKELTEKVIGAAIEAYQAMVPELLESAHEECLTHEMKRRGFNVPEFKSGIKRVALNSQDNSASSAPPR